MVIGVIAWFAMPFACWSFRLPGPAVEVPPLEDLKSPRTSPPAKTLGNARLIACDERW